jgi:undecaprenyl-diphosphatase
MPYRKGTLVPSPGRKIDDRHETAAQRRESVAIAATSAADTTLANIGLAAVALVTVLFTLMALVDRPLARYCHQHASAIHDSVDAFSTLGQAGWYLVPTLIIFLVGRFIMHRPAIAARGLYVFLAVALSGLASDVVKVLVGRARPWVLFRKGAYGYWPLQLNVDYQSFPSGHTSCVFALAFSLGVIAPRYRAPLLLAALLVSFTRIITGAHYLSDVVAGAALGWLVSVTLQRAFFRHGFPIRPVDAASVGLQPSALARRVLGRSDFLTALQ